MIWALASPTIPVTVYHTSNIFRSYPPEPKPLLAGGGLAQVPHLPEVAKTFSAKGVTWPVCVAKKNVSEHTSLGTKVSSQGPEILL